MGPSDGDDKGEESTHRLGEDGGEERVEVHACGRESSMEERKKVHCP
jgi:hypothetical protein